MPAPTVLLAQAPCQHNFCLACFGKWTAKGNKQCPTCRAGYPASFSTNPRINTALAVAIRMARLGERPAARAEQQRIANADRPDEAFTTDRAVSRPTAAHRSPGSLVVCGCATRLPIPSLCSTAD
jgi:E3 ubiquitin-protein ligase UHRF1